MQWESSRFCALGAFASTLILCVGAIPSAAQVSSSSSKTSGDQQPPPDEGLAGRNRANRQRREITRKGKAGRN